ncbi:MAG TPA: hypothetical protein VGD64_14930 [Acidisarcina sp.]
MSVFTQSGWVAAIGIAALRAGSRIIASQTPVRAFVRSLAPRKHLCVLPMQTRPSLFGGD